MKKRAQVTVFIILGIVILAAIALFFYARTRIFFGAATPERLENELELIKKQVEDCIQEISPEYIERIGLQGGYLITPPGTYRLYNNYSVSYLCYNQPGKPTCINRMLLLKDMEEDLSKHINSGLDRCINIYEFKKYGYDVKTGTRNTVVKIGKETVMVSLNYPITIRKDTVEVSKSEFSAIFNYPLGRLYDVSLDIIDGETEFGEFDQLIYMLAKRGQYIIDKQRPYPDKIYILKTKDSPYIFQFFIEGEPG